MAKVTEDLKERILADFHVGKSQNSLSRKYDLSPATINKICKGVTPKNIDAVNTLVAVKSELSEKSEYEVNAIHREVSEQTRHIILFNSATEKNITLLMTKVNASTSIYDHHTVQSTILKGKETVLGKQPETAIQINNNLQSKKQPTGDPETDYLEMIRA